VAPPRLKAYATKLDPGIRDSLAAVPRNPDDARSDWLTAFEAAFRRLVARGQRGPGGLSGAFSRMLWSPADVDGLLGTLGELGLWPAGLRTVRTGQGMRPGAL
jgi:hypothetical protein